VKTGTNLTEIVVDSYSTPLTCSDYTSSSFRLALCFLSPYTPNNNMRQYI